MRTNQEHSLPIIRSLGVVVNATCPKKPQEGLPGV
jgi:hypothetical protein